MIPKISVITVVFNDKSGFELTANSIISQTAIKDIEWFVIDAASTDGTVESIKKFVSNISYWISETDNGIYDGMNKGIEKATGLYSLFLNAGDTLYCRTTIETLLTHKDFGHYDYLSGHTIYTKDGKAIGKSMAPKTISGAYLFKRSLGHQSTLIRTDRLKEVKGYDTNYKIVADAKFFFEEIIIKNKSYQSINEYISNYDVTGISTRKHKENHEERERFLAETLPPKILSDYKRFVYGDTTLEKIICKLDRGDFLYKLITIFVIISYSPIALYNRVRIHIIKKH